MTIAAPKANSARAIPRARGVLASKDRAISVPTARKVGSGDVPRVPWGHVAIRSKRRSLGEKIRFRTHQERRRESSKMLFASRWSSCSGVLVVRPIERTRPADRRRSELPPNRVDRPIELLLALGCFTVEKIALTGHFTRQPTRAHAEQA